MNDHPVWELEKAQIEAGVVLEGLAQRRGMHVASLKCMHMYYHAYESAAGKAARQQGASGSVVPAPAPARPPAGTRRATSPRKTRARKESASRGGIEPRPAV